MSVQTKFSEEEWDVISHAPQLVGLACAASANSGIFGTVKESMASVYGMMEGVNKFEGNEIITAIAPKAGSFSDTKEKALEQKEWISNKVKGKVTEPAELLELAQEEAKKAVDLIKECCGKKEAKEYQEYVVSIAEKVAKSAKEGGFLGFGGTKISEGETHFITNLKIRLGYV